ncbi:hypothetical protein GLOIN_2v1790246 [Rhizophagus irregularis DAOM 181602=DAOM 197198]|uniref:Uncharacterized protein n=1 Tax=Rhizophagus irregularis (strain DAOM 181602 / DAOM 197198 / MUCL 43194) TaxID=747089 RepID=A0A2P4NZI5_RHIID|nr:hypothetical protein GLOIN_2v1790246 [Rhizophagus irregularis DAOM 181602=DAOM 197198]POG58549.1 hypothetical protein GLOIN_2v1790246 [Rhizophagus irregularis DAOM 181602=DAOM 197198]|eukprot:XP_025165415.1 hypothetical protein GLOIN_2v1790246 [Rhizophagus irregularis DAOM 181602=DAOM 197198]
MWTDDEVRMLIDERKEGNDHYHSLGGGVVRERGGPQPLQKSTRDTELLIQGARLLKNSMASEDPRGKQTRNGERYHLQRQQQDPDQDHKLRSQQQQQQQHQQNSDHPDQDQNQQQQQDQQVVQVFDDELEREDSSQASQSSLAIWEIDDD